MIRHIDTEISSAMAKAPTAVWGLEAIELHDAYWRARGVQCVRRGRADKLQKGADLFLLIEPGQLLLFDLAELVERIAWGGAAATRVRVQDVAADTCEERVVLDARGLVTRIARRYRPRTRASCRAILTRRKRIARMWMSAAPRDAWRRVRQLLAPSSIDRWRCIGTCGEVGRPGDASRLLGRLVETWEAPEAVIDGIVLRAGGVHCLAGQRMNDGLVVVGPVWLGATNGGPDRQCLIGPVCVPDVDGHGGAARVRVRDIDEIDVASPAAGRRRVSGRTRTAYAFCKRALDVVASACGLVVLSPLLVAISLAILFEGGRPIFFGHLRQTRGGRPFRCWKFRTMRRHSDAEQKRLAEANACDGPQFYIRDDPRVTKVGRRLRRFHLDELPQLFNVLVGEMSLVGPRPSPDRENRICPEWRDLRLSVRPGLTGLWQLNRTRAPGVDFQEWIRWDTEYVRRASFRLDVEIIIRTLRLFSRTSPTSSHHARREGATTEQM